MKMLTVKSARDLGPQFTENPHRIIGLDGAFSIPLGEQRALWFFGDTFVGTRPRGSLWYPDGKPVGPADMSGMGSIQRMINNTGAVVRGSTEAFSFILDDLGNVKCLIPLEGDEHPDRDRIWCQHGIARGARVYLSFIKVRMLPAGSCPFPVCFEIVGSGLAAASSEDGEFRRVRRSGTSVLWGADEPHFGTAFLETDSFVYVYGSVNRGGVQQCFIARTQSIEAVEQYEYLAGPEPSWYRDVALAIPLFERMPSELSVSYNEYLRCYLAVHSLDLTGQIVGRTAPAPWGPWSEPVVLWTVSVDCQAQLPYPRLVYAGKEHPELSGEGGNVIYLTYVEFEEYWPHLVEVTLE